MREGIVWLDLLPLWSALSSARGSARRARRGMSLPPLTPRALRTRMNGGAPEALGIAHPPSALDAA
jgi:hypothetical protein